MSYAAPIPPSNFKRWLVLGIVVAIMILLSGCSASWHIRRAQAKDPSMFSDTVRVEKIDTLIVEVPKIDTLFRQVRDTLIEYVQETVQGEVRIKYLWNTKTDSVFIEADCPDSEVVTKIVTEQLPPIVLEPTLWQRIEWLVYAMVLLAACYLLLKARRY